MTDNVSISLTWADDRPIEELQKAIAERVRFMGETTEKAVVATAINTLTSLRADTSIIGKKPTVFHNRWMVNVEEMGEYKVGYARPPRGSAHGRRVVRMNGGKAVDTIFGKRIINKAPGYMYSETLRLYKLQVYGIQDTPFRTVAVIARNPSDVEKFAWDEIIPHRIRQYRGISKRALGVAMHAVSSKASGGALSADLERLANSVIDVDTYGKGYSSGEFGLTVADNLPHAADALKSGSVDLALMKAANRTIGLINKRIGVSFRDKLETPFPDIVTGAVQRSGVNTKVKGKKGLYSSGRDIFVG